MTPSLEEKFMNDFTGHEALVRGVSSMYFADPADREDVFQEIVYQAWKSYPTFKRESKFSTWLYKVALNTAIMHVRKRKRVLPQEPMSVKIAETVLEDDHHREEQVKRLQVAVGTLAQVDKAIILLHLENISYEEIASVTGLSKSNVSVRLVRIKRKLEEILRNQ